MHIKILRVEYWGGNCETKKFSIIFELFFMVFQNVLRVLKEKGIAS